MNLNILEVMMISMTHFQRVHFFLMSIGHIELKTQIGGMNFVLNMMMEKLTFVLVQLTVTLTVTGL
jgi:hypothetical protein